MKPLCCWFFPLFADYTFTVKFEPDGRMYASPICVKCSRTGHWQRYHRVKKGYEGQAATELIEMLKRGEEP